MDEEELLAKHRKERKDLQAEIQKLKKSISKGDKKKKKEVAEEIAQLEADLNTRQESELTSLKSSKPTEEHGASNDTAPPIITEDHVEKEEEEEGEEESNGENQTKKSKAQRRRDKKANKDKEREHRIQEQEVENRQGPRQLEMIAVAKMLSQRGLALHEISADGNCMYNAISHQLALRNTETPCAELREKTANYMRNHPDDFIPFLVHPDTDSIMTPEQFSKYCDKTEKMPVWGGQLELRAMSEVLDLPIEVLQANVQPLVIGDTKKAQPITLVYHLHAYRLGEHYNSVRSRKPEDEDQPQE